MSTRTARFFSSLVPGIIPSQDKDFAFLFDEFHEVHQTIKVPLNGSTIVWHISHSSHFGVICKLAECTLCPRSLMKLLNRTISSIDTWRFTTSFSLPARLCLTDQHLLCSEFSKFSIHFTVGSCSSCFNSFSIRTFWGIVSKALLKSR